MAHDTYKGDTPRISTTVPIVVREFEIKDSGQRQSFESGMVRDVATDKTDSELIFNGPMADRWAEHLTKGAKKYPDVRPGVPNWTLADGQEELVRARKSAARHFRQWMRGDTDEDHAAATFFNINLYEYVKDRLAGEAWDNAVKADIARRSPQTIDEALRQSCKDAGIDPEKIMRKTPFGLQP